MATTSQSTNFRDLLIQCLHLCWVLILKVNFAIISAVHIFFKQKPVFWSGHWGEAWTTLMGSIHLLLQGITTVLRSNCSSFLNCRGKCETSIAFPVSCPWIILSLEDSHVFRPENSSFMLFSGSSLPVTTLLVSTLLLERLKSLSLFQLIKLFLSSWGVEAGWGGGAHAHTHIPAHYLLSLRDVCSKWETYTEVCGNEEICSAATPYWHVLS